MSLNAKIKIGESELDLCQTCSDAIHKTVAEAKRPVQSTLNRIYGDILAEMEQHQQDDHPVAKALYAALDTFEERGQTYDAQGGGNDGYLVAGEIMSILTRGKDWRLESKEEFAMFHCLTILVGKLVRFANSGYIHADSMHDIIVYAAMIRSLIKEDSE